MAEKRPREDVQPSHTVKKRKGFAVGPDSLPDGTWKRKNQQIKRTLIEKAKLKKQYAKIQAAEVDDATSKRPDPYADMAGDDDDDSAMNDPAPPARHPDRQAMIEAREGDVVDERGDERSDPTQRKRRPKSTPFAREQRAADTAREDAEMRRRAREEAERERQRKTDERDRFRRAMAKARTGGRNGQRKLGRESNILLEKVQRMVAEG